MSLDIKKDVSLVAYNSFAIDCIAETFITINSLSELKQALNEIAGQSFLVLGGGSNILFDQLRITVPVLWINIHGVEQQEIDDDRVIVRAMAGENWHAFIMWCLQQDYGGLENLSLIPGSVGAAPVQNIGAYGVEVKDVLHEVEALNIQNGEIRHFNNNECEFSYRNSIFKEAQKGRWVILSVSFLLSRKHHELRLDYGAIRESLQLAGISDPGIQDVSKAVIAIRKQRLPDPQQLPNAGSFFKNPVISKQTLQRLKADYPDIPCFEQADGKVKIPAGWLIEQCGWKGKHQGKCAVHELHALILVNINGATGGEVLMLARKIQESVRQKFNLLLSFEVNLSSDAACILD